MAILAAEAGDQVLNFVKASGLDFKIVETPFSLEIKIKKNKYNRDLNQRLHFPNCQKPPSQVPQSPPTLLTQSPTV